jgi:hypothetical protein
MAIPGFGTIVECWVSGIMYGGLAAMAFDPYSEAIHDSPGLYSFSRSAFSILYPRYAASNLSISILFFHLIQLDTAP